MSLTTKFRKLYDYFQFHPATIIIEPTNKCNLTCAVCFRSLPDQIASPEGCMGLDLFQEILAKSRGAAKSVFLYFRGEPLLHPELIRFIELCKAGGFATSISTNGLLLNEGLMEGMIRAGLDRITIDYDSIAGNDYEVIRGVKSADVVLGKIMAFHALKKRLRTNSPEIVIKALNRAHDPATVMAFVKRLEATGIAGKVQISDYFPWPNGKINPDFPYPLTPRARVCDMYYQGLTITYQGNIVICSYDYREDYPLGNIREFNSVAEIYKDARFRSFRRRLLFKQYQKQRPCNTCLLPILGLREGEYALNTMTGSMYDA